jgi:16S rRNA (adenine1518-N6/adenine1519-N6)-dimethyltransferase
LSVARPRRRFGQHFLANPRLLDRIAAALAPEPGQPVLEIGPGHGGLTDALLRHGARVTAVEIDRDLAGALQVRLPSVRVVVGDALEQDWPALLGDDAGRHLLTGNIPYNITSPLLDRALSPPRPLRIVFLVQREVADRVTARPATPEYGALTVGVQALATAERLFTVPAGAFYPPPRVESAVIRLTPTGNPRVVDQELPEFRRFVVGVFGFRRKQIQRALRELTGWEAERVGGVLATRGLSPAVRAETLDPAAFVALYRAVVDGGWRAG